MVKTYQHAWFHALFFSKNICFFHGQAITHPEKGKKCILNPEKNPNKSEVRQQTPIAPLLDDTPKYIFFALGPPSLPQSLGTKKKVAAESFSRTKTLPLFQNSKLKIFLLYFTNCFVSKW